jgi:hypothetical protein
MGECVFSVQIPFSSTLNNEKKPLSIKGGAHLVAVQIGTFFVNNKRIWNNTRGGGGDVGQGPPKFFPPKSVKIAFSY